MVIGDWEASLIAALSRVIWADGVLRPEEGRFFVDVVKGLKLPVDVASDIYRRVLTPDTSHTCDVSSLDEEDRRWILGFGFLMSIQDGEVADSEIAALRTLADEFGIGWDKAQQIFEEAEALGPQLKQVILADEDRS